MKTLFIEARKKFSEKIEIKGIKKIKGKIHLLYSIQYKNLAMKIKKKLEKRNNISGFEQVLGCSKVKPRGALVLIGSGTFHALNLSLSANKEVYVYDHGRLNKIGKKEIEDYNNKIKGKISRFLVSGNIGIIFSIKAGQSRLKEADKIKTILKNKYKDKNFYTLLSDNIDMSELENFNIDFFINTACPGLELDSRKIINYEKLPSLEI